MKKTMKKITSVFMALAMVVSINTFEVRNVTADTATGTEVSTTTHEHEMENNVCKTCGFVQDAKENVTYTTFTTETDLFQIIEFTAPRDGEFQFLCTPVSENAETWDAYAYLFEKSESLESKIAEAQQKILAGEECVRLEDSITSDDDGSGVANLPAITVELTKDITYCLVVGPYNNAYGEFNVTIQCTHLETVVKNRTFADCTNGGYTGDTHCAICDKKLEKGQSIPAGEHKEAVFDENSVIKKTCTKDGFTGNYICPDCKVIITEGTVDAALGHAFENGVCKTCGFVEKAQTGVIYTTYTTEENYFQIIEYTALGDGNIQFKCSKVSEDAEYWDAYGYLFEKSDDLEEKIAQANKKIKNGEGNVRLEGFIADDDDDAGDGMPLIAQKLKKGTTYCFVVGPYSSGYGKFNVEIICGHENIIVENDTFDDCTLGGYTGDVHCEVCGKELEKGKTIAAGEHQIIVNDKKEANCYHGGYTGDTVCEVCDKEIEKGKTIPKQNHAYENDVCKYCGRIRNAQLDKNYDTVTTENNLFQVIEFTAPRDGEFNINFETGFYAKVYLFEKSDSVEQKIAKAEEKYAKGNEYAYLTGYIECVYNYEWATMEVSLEKGKTYCIVIGPDGYSDQYGEISVVIECAHITHTEGKTLSSCGNGGYTGDVICEICGITVEEGETIAAGSEHQYIEESFRNANCKAYKTITYVCVHCGDSYTEEDTEAGYGDHDYEITGRVERTCTTDGYSGDKICALCGAEGEKGEVLTAYHNISVSEGSYNEYFEYYVNEVYGNCIVDSYTGDTVCTVCDEIIKAGETTKAEGHKYENGICNNCGLKKDFLTIDTKGYYLIDTAEDLVEFIINADKGIKGKLMNDITFPEDYENNDWDYECAYYSILDGNNHTISNFNIEGEWFGLFDEMQGSTVKNLTIAIKIDEHPDHSFGAIAQDAYKSVFENCTVNGYVKTTEERSDMAGFAGEADYCNFTNCTNNANIYTEGGNVGGIVGDGEYNNFENCVNNGNIHGSGDENGGIAGENSNAIFKNCINNGCITTKDEQTGGIAGNAYTSQFIDCKNTGDIKYIGEAESMEELGGILGSGYDYIEIIGCENSGNIGCDDKDIDLYEVGGIVGEIYYGGKITDCVNNGNVTAGGFYAGGICGDVEADDESEKLEISNCINNGDVYAGWCAGGILGFSTNVDIRDCVNNGDVTGVRNVAGISGYAQNATIDNVINAGEIKGYNSENTNGLVCDSEEVNITNSEEQHSHKYTETAIEKATLTTDGTVKKECVCGHIIKSEVVKRISDVAVDKTTYTYTGKNIVPVVTVKDSVGKVINAKYYTVTYVNKSTGKTVTAIKNAGTYNVKIAFKGAYAGEVTKTITVKKSGGTTNSSVKKPAKTKIKKIENIKKKKIKLTWKKISGVTGYQVRYATNKKFKKAKIKTIKKNKTKFTIKKLKKKKYYVQVRAYKVVNGKTYTGKWSKRKSVKVKK